MKKGSFLLILLYCLSACSNKQNDTTEKIKILVSNAQNNYSTIYFLDKKTNKLEHYTLDSPLGLSQQNIQIKNDTLYEIKDITNNNSILSINLKNYKQSKINSLNEVPNIRYLNDNYLYYSSNFTNKNTLNIYNLNSKTTKKLNLENYFINHIVSYEQFLYLFCTDNENDIEYLFKYDKSSLNKLSSTKIKYPTSPNNNVVVSNNKLYYTYQINKKNYLIEISDKQSIYKKLSLTNNYIYLNENKFYFLKKDIYNRDNLNNKIEVLDSQTSTILKYENNILDMLLDNKTTYLFLKNSILKFNNTIKEKIEFKFRDDEIFVGSEKK